MELLDVNRSVLVAIDLQGKLMDRIHRPPMVIEATRRLLTLADLFEVPVVLTEQYPRGLGPTIAPIREAFDALATPKRHIEKTSFGCCGDAKFREALDALRPPGQQGPRQVVLAGIEAHVCVMQTAIELLQSGDQVHLAWDAVSSRGEEYRRHALERMEQAGGIVTNHESVAFEWARHKDHPQFKPLNALLREGQPEG